MKLTLTADTITSKSVISKLAVDGAFECYVLEPPNPISAGVFIVKILHSLKFDRLMPFLLGVPGHTGIEIHWGNTAKDTKDCLIVGRTKAPDFVGESKLAFEALFAKLSQAEPITIEITRQAIPPAAQPAGVTIMQQLDSWFNSPRGHAIGMLIFAVAAQMYPQYASALQTVAYAFGYGAVVAGATPAKP